MFNFKDIPSQHKQEFLAKRTEFIRARIRLFALMAFGIYFLVTFLSIFTAPPGEFKPEEIYVWLSLTAGTILVLYLNNKVRTVLTGKISAYLFTAFLLIVLTKVCMIYVEYAYFSSPLYVFMLFLVSITIPITAMDVIIMTVMHIAAYASYFVYVNRFYLKTLPTPFGYREFADGLMLLGTAFLLCLVIRRKETARDIENFILMKDIEEKNQKMQDELALARRVHQTLIPKSISTDLVDIAVMYLPMRYIGGDYARFHFVEKDRLIFIISDVTGHGVSAALLVNRIHTEFERLAKDGKYPGNLLKELDTFIKGDFSDTHMYLSAFCGLLDFGAMKFSYSNYGHPPQYIYRVRKSAAERLASQTALLGLPIGDETIYQNEITFDKGDMIFLFTDGVIETVGKTGEEYGMERFENFIQANHALSVDGFNQRLLEELNAYKRSEFKDDISLLGIKVK